MSLNELDKLTSMSLIPFPKDILPKDEFINKIEILKQTLISYSKLDFKFCFFNIEIEAEFESFKEDIIHLINQYFPTTKKNLHFIRPSKKAEWIEDVIKINNLFDSNEIILLAQNHDHLFIDHQNQTFYNIIDKVFNKEDDFGKCLIYSHIPSLTSKALNKLNDGAFVFNENKDYLFKSKKVINYFDSIVLLSLETLKNIVTKIKFDGDYFGRFDWPGLYYKNLKLNYYFYPREFFKHYDGYFNETGNRIMTDLSVPNKNLSLDMFYYEKYLDNFLLTIRDKLAAKNIFQNTNQIYKKAILESLVVFDKTYFENDFNVGFISEVEQKLLKNAVLNKISFNYNLIFSQILVDIKLNRKPILYKFKIAYIIYLKNSFFIKIAKKLIPRGFLNKLKAKFSKF